MNTGVDRTNERDIWLLHVRQHFHWHGPPIARPGLVVVVASACRFRLGFCYCVILFGSVYYSHSCCVSWDCCADVWGVLMHGGWCATAALLLSLLPLLFLQYMHDASCSSRSQTRPAPHTSQNSMQTGPIPYFLVSRRLAVTGYGMLRVKGTTRSLNRA